MKKTKKWLLCAVAALSMGLAIGATACGEKEPDNNSGSSNSEQQQVEKSIKLNVETVTIKQFDTAVLTYTLTGIPATTEIVWTSSDPSAVAVEKGKISAFKTGTVIITVTAGEYSDTVSVTVEASNDVPQLTLSQMDAKLKVGKSVTVYSDVVFRGESVDEQPEIEWSTESDAITLAPKTDGSVVITAVKPVTQAVVTAKTIYFGKEILQAVVVEVVEDTEFSISENATSLYTFTYGEDYKESITLVATVLSSGNEVSDAIVEWCTDDDTVATVANGVVTAVGAGEATITAKYVSTSGIEHVEECIVTVSVPSIQTGKNAKIYLNSEDGDQVVNLVDDLGVTNTDLSYKVIDVATDEEMPVTVDGASFTFAITDKKLCGERAIKLVVDGKVEIQATLTVVTKVLMTAEEVANIKSYGVLEDVTDTGYTLYGYFLLGADVDLASAGELGIRNYSAGESKGFIGGFDGQGHTIANMRVIGSGLFGEIANGTVIRNTAFMGVYIDSDLSGALGKNCYGVIENCLIDIGFTHGVNMGNCSGVVDSIDGEGASIRNCVVYYPSSAHKSQALSRYLLNGGSYENVAVIGTDKLVDYDNKTNTTISGVTPYAADVALSDVDFSFVTGDYWKFDGEKVYFDGYDALIKGMVSAGEYPESITNGESASLSALPADLEYVLEIADGYKDYVTLDGTTLTIANEISESFSFNISVSNWNGIDLGFSKTVNVKKIENIIVKTVNEHTLYNYSGAELVANSKDFLVDLSSELTADIPSALTWKAYSGTTELANVTDYLTISAKTMTIPTEALVAAGFSGEIVLIGENVEGSYKLTVPVLLVTASIDNVTELSAFVDATQEGGYYVLGGNIYAEGYAFNCVGTFTGTFDGRGYAIDGMTVASAADSDKSGGLFGTISAGSIVKNLALTGIKFVAHPYAFISPMTGSNYMYGTIQDCYIEIVSKESNIAGYNADGMHTRGVVGTVQDGMLKNVVVKSSVALEYGISEYVLGSASVVSNTYFIGTASKLVNWVGNGASESNVSTANVATLTAEQQATFNAEIWGFDNGIPYFKAAANLAEQKLEIVKAAVNAIEVPDSLTEGDTVTLPTLPYGLAYVLDVDSTNEARVTLNGNELTIAVGIDNSFSFVLKTSQWNDSDLGKTWTINVKAIENIIVKTVNEHALYNYSGAELVANSKDFLVDLSSELTADIPSALTWKAYSGTTELANVTDYLTISGKTISVSTATLISARFLGEIKLVGESADGNYKLTLPVCIVTASITKAEELTAFASASQTGYFVLGANINASGLTLNNVQATFTGTFDGRGYAIDGATYSTPDTNEEAGGLFGAIAAESIIKNVALTNSKILAHPYVYFGVMTGGATSLGTITDCFVEIVEAKSNVDGYNLMNMTSGLVGNAGGGAITNVIVKYGDGVGVKNAITEMVHSGTQISNAYVIGGTCNRNNGWVDTATSSASITNVTSLSAEQQATFNVDVWAFDESGNPSFKKKNA